MYTCIDGVGVQTIGLRLKKVTSFDICASVSSSLQCRISVVDVSAVIHSLIKHYHKHHSMIKEFLARFRLHPSLINQRNFNPQFFSIFTLPSMTISSRNET